MNEFKINLLTYDESRDNDDDEPFQQPRVPVLAVADCNLRIVLGSHDVDDYDKPDLLIERLPKGWRIILHPVVSPDPIGAVVFADDGRVFLVRELLGQQVEIVDSEPDLS